MMMAKVKKVELGWCYGPNCVPQNTDVEALTPRTSACDSI